MTTFIKRITILLVFNQLCCLCFSEEIPYKKIYFRDNLQGNLKILNQSKFDRENTIFIIEDCYELDGEIVLPKGCILKFEGGSFYGGKLIGNYNDIVAPKYKIFENVRFEG